MSLQKIIQESIAENPLGLKEALQEELSSRIAKAISEKTEEFELEDVYLEAANILISEDLEVDDLTEEQLDELLGAAAKLVGKGIKKALVNKQGNFRFSTAGRADSAEAQAKKLEKARNDRARLLKAKEKIQREKQMAAQGKLKEETVIAESDAPAYHYYVTNNTPIRKELKMLHDKKKPFATERDAFDHIKKQVGRKDGIIHKVHNKTGKIVSNRGVADGQAGYVSDVGLGDPKHIKELP